MRKGVNKQVLEIAETGNGFFEKAIFFVKPEYSGMSEGRLRESARKEIENAGKPPVTKRSYPQKMIGLCAVGGAFVTGVITTLIFFAIFN